MYMSIVTQKKEKTMSCQNELLAAKKRIGNIELKGLLRKEAVIPKGQGQSADDVPGFNYIVHDESGVCYSYYAANPPLIGMTQPTPIPCPLGIQIINDYKIDYKQAIEIFKRGDWGDRFTSMVLSEPLTFPQAKEPYWYMLSNLGVNVVIGANTGEVYQ
jgi:hypothetical protein